MNILSEFIKKISWLSFVICVLAFIIYFFAIPQYYLPVFPVIIILFYSVSTAAHYFLLKSLSARLAQFTNTFMLATSAKLMVYMLFAVIYLLINKKQAVNFLIPFAALYFIFLIFDVVQISNEIKKVSGKK